MMNLIQNPVRQNMTTTSVRFASSAFPPPPEGSTPLIDPKFYPPGVKKHDADDVSALQVSIAGDDITNADKPAPKRKGLWVAAAALLALGASAFTVNHLKDAAKPGTVAQQQEERASLPPTPPLQIPLGNGVVTFNQQTGVVTAGSAGGAVPLGSVSMSPQSIAGLGNVYIAKDNQGNIIAYGTEAGQIITNFPEEEHWWQEDCRRIKVDPPGPGSITKSFGCEIEHVTLPEASLVVGYVDVNSSAKDDIRLLSQEDLVELHGINSETNELNNTEGTSVLVDTTNTTDSGDILNADANGITVGQRAAIAALAKRSSLPETRIDPQHTEQYVEEHKE